MDPLGPSFPKVTFTLLIQCALLPIPETPATASVIQGLSREQQEG